MANEKFELFVPKGSNMDALMANATANLQASGMTNVNISDDIDPKLLPAVGNTPVLVKGTQLIITGKLAEISGENRRGDNIRYAAMLCITREGKSLFLPYRQLMDAWLPEEFTDNDGRASMYSANALDKIAAWYAANNKAAIINSPKANYTFATGLDERLAALNGPIEVADTVSIDGTLTMKDSGEQRPFKTRLIAFKRLTTTESAAFKKAVEKAVTDNASA